MTDKITTLEVVPEKIRHWRVLKEAKEAIVNDYEVRVGRNRDPHTKLETFRDLSNVDQLDMRIKIGDKVVDVDIPDEMKKRLAEYLADDRYPFYKSNFDCLSFVHLMMGQPYKFNTGVDLNRFNLPKVDDIRSLAPGDVVHFAHGNVFKNTDGRHAALYIGSGYFISKLGDWKLSVQDTSMIKKHYGDSNVFKQVLKPQD